MESEKRKVIINNVPFTIKKSPKKKKKNHSSLTMVIKYWHNIIQRLKLEIFFGALPYEYVGYLDQHLKKYFMPSNF